MRETALEEAIRIAGGATELAKRLNKINPKRKISRQAISKWRRVPAERVRDVERATGVPRNRLRPDLYG